MKLSRMLFATERNSNKVSIPQAEIINMKRELGGLKDELRRFNSASRNH